MARAFQSWTTPHSIAISKINTSTNMTGHKWVKLLLSCVSSILVCTSHLSIRYPTRKQGMHAIAGRCLVYLYIPRYSVVSLVRSLSGRIRKTNVRISLSLFRQWIHRSTDSLAQEKCWFRSIRLASDTALQHHQDSPDYPRKRHGPRPGPGAPATMVQKNPAVPTSTVAWDCDRYLWTGPRDWPGRMQSWLRQADCLRRANCPEVRGLI